MTMMQFGVPKMPQLGPQIIDPLGRLYVFRSLPIHDSLTEEEYQASVKILDEKTHYLKEKEGLIEY